MRVTYVHGIPAGRDFTSVALSQTPEDGVGERDFPQVGQELLIDLESGEVFYRVMSDGVLRNAEPASEGTELGQRTGSLDSLLGESIKGRGLVALGVDELVVEDLNLGVVAGQANNLVGDGLGVGEGGNILANTREGKLDVLGLGTLQLGLALLAEDDELVSVGLLGEETTDVTGQTGVNTTAETLVGRADDEQNLLVLALEGLGLSLGEDLAGGLAVVLGLSHGALGAGQLGRGDNLHGLGDLLDVANGLETALDFTEGREAGGGIGGGGDGAVRVGK